MTDIVERLRDDSPAIIDDLMAEAADEIERLKEFINNCAMMFDYLGYKTQARECRAALSQKEGE